MTITFGASYLYDAFSDEKRLIREAKRKLDPVDFDTMIGTGLSGALVIPILARAMDKYWAIVRKDNDGSHSSSEIEGTIGERWIFVDDFVNTGATHRRVQEVVCRVAAHTQPVHVGVYCYHTGPSFTYEN